VSDDEPPPPGHNLPPRPSLDWTAEEWTDWLLQAFEGVVALRHDRMASYDRFRDGYGLLPPASPGEPPIGIDKWSTDVQGRAGDLRDKIAGVLRAAEAIHTLEKAPVLVAQRAIDGFLRNFRIPLDDAIVEIRRRQTLFGKWQEYESRRHALEEAARQRQEAEAALQAAARTMEPADLQTAADASAMAVAAKAFADAKPAEHTRTHGEHGSVTSLRTTWIFVPGESDVVTLAKAVAAGKAPASYLTFNETRIRLAIRVENVRAIPGCTIREEAVAR
jgi:hypothetical protein